MNEFKVTRVGEIIRTGDLSCKVDFDVAGNTYLFTIEFSEEPGNTAFTCRNVSSD